MLIGYVTRDLTEAAAIPSSYTQVYLTFRYISPASPECEQLSRVCPVFSVTPTGAGESGDRCRDERRLRSKSSPGFSNNVSQWASLSHGRSNPSRLITPMKRITNTLMDVLRPRQHTWGCRGGEETPVPPGAVWNCGKRFKIVEGGYAGRCFESDNLRDYND